MSHYPNFESRQPSSFPLNPATVVLGLVTFSVCSALIWSLRPSAHVLAPVLPLRPAVHWVMTERLHRWQQALDLTEDQKNQLQAFWVDYLQTADRIRRSHALSPEEQQARLEKLHQGFERQIHNILTPEQFQKLAAMHQTDGPR